MPDRTFPKGTPIEKVMELLVTPVEYQEMVLTYLEYIGYPDIILDYNPEQVARSVSSACKHFQNYLQSPRLCALAIFGMTWEFQIVRNAKGKTVQ